MIPTREDCHHLMEKYKVPIGIKKHCQVVNTIAVFLAKKLKAAGVDIDVDLVDAASLLHDLVRVVNFYAIEDGKQEEIKVWQQLKEKYGHMDHAVAAYEILKDIYPKVAEVIVKHGCEAVIKGEPKSWEEKVVAYADRRVMHTQVVTVEERYEDLEHRHADFFEKTGLDPNAERKKILKMEKDIFGSLKFKPEELLEELKKEKK